jgi:hypothetical protein
MVDLDYFAAIWRVGSLECPDGDLVNKLRFPGLVDSLFLSLLIVARISHRHNLAGMDANRSQTAVHVERGLELQEVCFVAGSFQISLCSVSLTN